MVSSPASAKSEYEDETSRLCILDWDDTLCPSSWISSKQLSSDGIAENDVRLLRIVEEGISRLLSCVESLGCTVVIITNADEEWVRFSCARFLPRVVPLLASVQVISARQYEGIYPGRSVCWKAAAFTHVAKAYFSHQRSDRRRQMISIGDSNDERLAVKAAATPLHALPKAIKLVDSPRLHTVACQLETIAQCLESIVLSRHTLDLDVSTILNYMHVKARAEQKIPPDQHDHVDSPQLLERVWHDAAWGLLAAVRFQGLQQQQLQSDDTSHQQDGAVSPTTTPTNATLHRNGQRAPATATPLPIPELPAAA